MSTSIMIIGASGTGKTASLRNLNPEDVLLIQAVKKPLPFKSSAWRPATKANPAGSIFVTDQSHTIILAMERTKKPIIVVDDFQYIMANEYMRRHDEVGYTKFTEIAKHIWDIIMAANNLTGNKRVYFMAHSEENEQGKIKAKTIGKLLDDKITLEGLITIVLRTVVSNGHYMFATQNSGHDTCKSPIGLFADETIPNDLAAVDAAICDYFDLNQEGEL